MAAVRRRHLSGRRLRPRPRAATALRYGLSPTRMPRRSHPQAAAPRARALAVLSGARPAAAAAAGEAANPFADQGGNYNYRSYITAVRPRVQRPRPAGPASSPTGCELTNRTGADGHDLRLPGRALRARARQRHRRAQHPLARDLPERKLLRRREGPADSRSAAPRNGRWSIARASSNGTTTASTGPRRRCRRRSRTRAGARSSSTGKCRSKSAPAGARSWASSTGCPRDSSTPTAAIVVGVVIVLGGAAVRALRPPPPRAQPARRQRGRGRPRQPRPGGPGRVVRGAIRPRLRVLDSGA